MHKGKKNSLKRNDNATFKTLTPLEAVHESAMGLYNSELIDAKAMHDFNKLCLLPEQNIEDSKIK